MFDDETGVMVPPNDAAALTRQIAALWEQPARSESLGVAGLAFAQRHCSEQATIDYVNHYLAAMHEAHIAPWTGSAVRT